MQELNKGTATKRRAASSLFPLFLIAGAFLLGICWSAEINKGELVIIVSHLKAVWSLPSNRPVVLRIFFTLLLTGTVLAALTSAFVYVWTWLKSQEGEQNVSSVSLPQQGTLLLTDKTKVTPHATRENTGTLAATSRSSPVTPIPPFLDTVTTVPSSQQSIVASVVTGSTHLEPHGIESVSRREQESEKPPYIEIMLLGYLKMRLRIPGSRPGTYRTYSVRVEDLNSKHKQLIAYVAWPQGGSVMQGKMRDSIYGTDEADPEQVQQALNTGKKEVRRRIAAAVAQAKNDGLIVPNDLDVFEVDVKSYRLNRYCGVVDLSTVDTQYAIIEEALKSHQLINRVPVEVYHACMTLIQAYTGNFLEEALVESHDTLDDWTENWARQPFTEYKHRYLQALFYAGEHMRKQGDQMVDDAKRQREYYHDAASLFARGAMAACDARVFDGLFDEYVSFNRTGVEDSPHVSFGEQMVRRAVACYGRIGNTTLADSTYTKYTQQMLRVSQGVWTPQAETVKDIKMAREKTGAYRFSETIGSPFHLGSPVSVPESA